MVDTPKPAPPPEEEEPVPAADSWRTEVISTRGQPAPAAGGALVGQSFGDFELLEEIGRGGMGVVYKARQKSLERDVALKMLLPQHTTNALLLSRFLTEARAAASLHHPNIVSVYQVGECAAGPYFVMEHIDGGTLEPLIGRRLPVAWSVALLLAVAEAVQHAHDQGIIHRDLKPSNIMLHRSRRPVVMDFGIAKVVGQVTGLSLHGAVVGTPSYMPPEQAGDDPTRVGPHSDVYSLGALLYALLTGRPPFDEGAPMQTLVKVASPEVPPSVRKLRPDVPRPLEKVVMKCLRKPMADRYPTAQALADDLRRLRTALTAKPAAGTSVVLIAPGGKQVRLHAPTTVLGRAAGCDLPIRASEVSKRHCRIVLTADEAVVEDLGSSNGTFLNGAAVRRAKLSDGDELDVGGRVFKVRVVRTR